MIAARAVLTPINTRLKPQEVAYILEHSGSRLILVDYEYTHLISGTKIPSIVSNDTGRLGDPYETFLSQGRQFSKEQGWEGLGEDPDENAAAVLCYTSVPQILSIFFIINVKIFKFRNHWTGKLVSPGQRLDC